MRYANININQQHLAHNLTTIKHQTDADTKVLAMVKANAYGHGIDATLAGLMQADGFGVATMAEGLNVFNWLNNHGQQKSVVLIEGVFSESEWQTALEHGFGCLIHHQAQLEWALSTVPTSGFSRTIWLKYNTGMSRLGFSEQAVFAAAQALHQRGYQLILTGHFACSDDINHPLNRQQIDRFNAMLLRLRTEISENIQGSLCNSAGIFNFPEVHHQWVRAGIALYGSSPLNDKSAQTLGLLPAMTFSAKIMAIHQLQIGESVGYSALWTADKPSTIGVISVGYGDGYPRVVQHAQVLHLSSGQSLPIVGRVAMDMLMIDLSGSDAKLDDEVVLWGDGLPADTVANWANTISYELFCRTTTRPTRTLKALAD